MNFEQLEWPEIREECRDLPVGERRKVAAAMFWCTVMAPVPSAPDHRWNRYAEGLGLIGLPLWAIDDIMDPHLEWKLARNQRRRTRRTG